MGQYLCGSILQPQKPDHHERGLTWIILSGLRTRGLIPRTIRNMLLPGWGSGLCFDKVGDILQFDPDDPRSLINELRSRELAGIVVWFLPLCFLRPGRLYLIDEDDMPPSILREAFWCAAVYPSNEPQKVALRVGSENLRKVLEHPNFGADDWDYSPRV
ncbi:hypothetical protein AOL_s00006g523 [Orbilia oligospora ATCC 24927]|uniref:Uncharacterized protein n=2 Tax=Orbilia oligospora TaxID=2813651 RepID=G1X0X2_ARTOA|nr:hypothetical protein AOL_s00006g523 [Orbilia oligospora ATCC 24927]EGX53145.1 hypothetical protein AOL_s00006g523 [Orbilia oligospora ATCC 24927]KAF3291508.1 hypothetical protein TWF970_000721 [Orbilia oligospora]